MTAEPPPLVARVVLDTPLPVLDRLFDYLVGEEIRDGIAIGSLVRVPLRSSGRQVLGYVADLVDNSDFMDRLTSITSLVSQATIMPRSLFDLARTVADRQVGTVADVLRQAIPRRYVRAEKSYLASLANVPQALGVPSREPAGESEVASETNRRLWLETSGSSVRGPQGTPTTAWSAAMCREVRQCLSRAQSAILCVPDFRDVRRLEADLAAEGLKDRVCRLDAETDPSLRWVNYLRCVYEPGVIAVGTRSAVFAPVLNLGLIAMWDDGDPSFMEPQAPYAHTREVALVRAQAEECSLIFLADSPSTDVVRLVDLGWLEHDASQRPQSGKVVPLDDSSREVGTGIPSIAWRAAQAALRTGPVLVQVPRPGFAGLIVCSTCREPARCGDCGGPLRRRGRDEYPECRWCGSLATAFTCSSCSGTHARDVSPGSEMTAEMLGRSFPGVPVAVSTGERVVFDVENKPALVVATPGAEPFCPGGYAVVIALDAERQLASPRLRVVEDALRTWTNACSLTSPDGCSYVVGVGDRLGRVLATHTQVVAIRAELSERSLLHLPPAARMATISGAPSHIRAVVEAVNGLDTYGVIGPHQNHDGSARLLVPFPYSATESVTTTLKALVLKSAIGRRGTGPISLRVRLDEAVLSSP